MANLDLPRRTLQAARCILAASGVVRLDADHYRVQGTRPDAASVRVYRRGAGWRCSSDRRHHDAKPCAHILAVLEIVGAVRLPATATAVRREALEAEAARLLPERWPVLLARMLDASPAANPPPPGRGRPKASPHEMLHQALTRAFLRHSLRQESGVGRATLRRFLASPAAEALARGLLDWTLADARPQDATRPDACNRSVLPFTTPTGPLVMEATWTPTYGLLARPRWIEDTRRTPCGCVAGN
ncbi:MAG: hypothetical protein QOD77_225 [Thermoplasmata archaeon]|jgi:hypothetical protein|nr:hypothetical protein [Thermoplasmata archaeon]